MNEENKTQDDGYEEVDVTKPQKEEPDKNYEVEETVEDNTVEAKKEETEESKDSEPQELAGS